MWTRVFFPSSFRAVLADVAASHLLRPALVRHTIISRIPLFLGPHNRIAAGTKDVVAAPYTGEPAYSPTSRMGSHLDAIQAQSAATALVKRLAVHLAKSPHPQALPNTKRKAAP